MTGEHFSMFVAGRPAPQGSKRFLGVRGGKGITVESSKEVAPWRADVRAGVLDRRGDVPPMTGPLQVVLTFVMPRPVSTPKRSTPAAVKRPDVDKLARAVLDAIGSAGLWVDDSQVTWLLAMKRIAELREKPGCHITISPADSPGIDWRRIAVQLARAGDGSFRLLSTTERDALETEMDEQAEVDWSEWHERTRDAAGLEAL